MSAKLANDVAIELVRVGGPGGQHAGSRQHDMRLTHIPTGVVVFIPASLGIRSQHRMRAAGLEAIEWILSA